MIDSSGPAFPANMKVVEGFLLAKVSYFIADAMLKERGES